MTEDRITRRSSHEEQMNEFFHVHHPTVLDCMVAEQRRWRARDAWQVARTFLRGIRYEWARTHCGNPDWVLVVCIVCVVEGHRESDTIETWRRVAAWRDRTGSVRLQGRLGSLQGLPIVVDDWND